MLHILLTILKIIGLILLVVLGLIIFLVVCILFVPIRYKADIAYDKKLKLTVKVTYLLHFISLYYDWDNRSEVSLRVCGIKTHFLDKDKKEENKKYDEDTKMFEEMSEDIRRNEEKNELPDKFNGLKKFLHDEKAADENFTEEKQHEDKTAGDKTTDDAAAEDTHRSSVIKRIIKKIKAFFYKIKYRFKVICGTIKKICRSVAELKAFLTDEGTKEAFRFVKKEVAVLLKHIRPRKIKGYIHYGFDDPSVTGRILGFIYMLSGGTHKSFQINADFEDKVLEGEVHVRGYVQIYVLLIIAWRLYKNENLKEVLERRRTYGRQ